MPTWMHVCSEASGREKKIGKLLTNLQQIHPQCAAVQRVKRGAQCE